MTKLTHKQIKMILLFRIVSCGVIVPNANNEMIINDTMMPSR